MRSRVRFRDRAEAGAALAERLSHLRASRDVVVVGLPRGGVPVAEAVAAALDAPLDVIVVRKLGVPFQPELGMGAIGEDGVRVLNPEVVRISGVGDDEIAAVEARERAELERRAQRFRAGRERIPLAGRTVVVIDDGIATGSTAKAACEVARAEGAARVVLAVPVAPADWTERLAGAADELVAVATPEPFYAVGQFYDDFSQTTDAEVVASLRRAAARRSGERAAAAPGPQARDEEVAVDAGGVDVGGHLTVPEGATGVVLFAHGSGSSRHSPRNRFVASILHDAGIGTLLFDLLTEAEEVDRANVFDIELLAGRLLGATRWLRGVSGLDALPLGYFGASTGAAAALWAAAEPDAAVAAVVSRGGRPDLAGPRLATVRAPTLLVVGGEDRAVLELNRRAVAELRCEHRLAVVPGATHLFEEPGTLRIAAELACDWFAAHLAAARRPAS
jgi:putative phosphoribosyl transferase